MKRNMDLVRDLLLSIEDEKMVNSHNAQLGKKYSAQEIRFHLEILQQGLLIIGYNAGIPLRLTWKGYEYLDKIRETKRWIKIRNKLTELGGDFSYETLTQTVSQMLSSGLLGSFFG